MSGRSRRSKKPDPGVGDLSELEGGFRLVDKIQFANFLDAIRAGKPEKLNAEIEDIFLSNAFCLTRQHLLPTAAGVAF